MNKQLLLAVLLLRGLGQIGWAQASDPVATLKTFSEFQQVDFKRLLAGEILAERGSLMNYANGISVETCYAVALPPEAAAKRTQIWDPAPHAALKVYEYHSLSDPCVITDFQALTAKSRTHSVRGLLDKSVAASERSSDFNLSHAEAGQLGNCVKRNHSEDSLAGCWSKILLGRVQALQKGYKDVVAYDTESGPVHPISEIHAILIDQTKIATEFAPILNACGLFKTNAAIDLSPYYYWSFFDADYHDTFNLGVIYRMAVGDHYQIADVEYYVSGGYYCSVTLYEVWPIKSGNQSGSLIWRGDLLSAPMLAYTRGTERLAYGALMLQDIKSSIRFFQEDMKGKR